MAEGTAVATAAISSAMVAAAEATAEATEEETPPECAYGNDYDGQMGLRISAIFVILVGSLFGECGPGNHLETFASWVFKEQIADPSRRPFPHLGTVQQRRTDSVVGLFHSKVFRFRCHRRHGFHTRRNLPAKFASFPTQTLTLFSFSRPRTKHSRMSA